MTEEKQDPLERAPRACWRCGGTGYDDSGTYNGLPPGECPECRGTGDDPKDKR